MESFHQILTRQHLRILGTLKRAKHSWNSLLVKQAFICCLTKESGDFSVSGIERKEKLIRIDCSRYNFTE